MESREPLGVGESQIAKLSREIEIRLIDVIETAGGVEEIVTNIRERNEDLVKEFIMTLLVGAYGQGYLDALTDPPSENLVKKFGYGPLGRRREPPNN